MVLPRVQFTVGRLLRLIICCAIVFALLRTPFWPLVLTFCLVLLGFLVHRSRGGNGIAGGTFAGCLTVGGFGIAVATQFYLVASPTEDGAYIGALCATPISLWIGLSVGFFLSVFLYLVARVVERDL